jgi:hypothetical protein
MWLLIALAAITGFWILSIYLRDDGSQVEDSAVINDPSEQRDNTRLVSALTWAIGLGLAVALGFVFL